MTTIPWTTPEDEAAYTALRASSERKAGARQYRAAWCDAARAFKLMRRQYDPQAVVPDGVTGLRALPVSFVVDLSEARSWMRRLQTRIGVR